jgi:hypothetical protein
MYQRGLYLKKQSFERCVEVIALILYNFFHTLTVLLGKVVLSDEISKGRWLLFQFDKQQTLGPFNNIRIPLKPFWKHGSARKKRSW